MSFPLVAASGSKSGRRLVGLSGPMCKRAQELNSQGDKSNNIDETTTQLLVSSTEVKEDINKLMWLCYATVAMTTVANGYSAAMFWVDVKHTGQIQNNRPNTRCNLVKIDLLFTRQCNVVQISFFSKGLVSTPVPWPCVDK